MSLLKTVAVNEAQGKVKEIFNEVESAVGMVPNIVKFLSVNPKTLENQWDSVRYISSMSQDGQKLHNILRYLMSVKNGCDYCSGIIKMTLGKNLGIDEQQLDEIQKDPSTVPLSQKNKAIFLFTLKAIDNPESITKGDISELETLGCEHIELFDAIQTATHMYTINTLTRTFQVQKDF